MKQYAAPVFRRSMISLCSSWRYLKDSFAGKFDDLAGAGMFDENGQAERIWETKSKFVLKVPDGEGRFVVYKSYRRISKPAKYILRPSPCGFEAFNYKLIKNCGIPVPELLAAGETRKCFILKTAFLVTEFADGFRDGRDFMPGGSMVEEVKMKDEFLRGHLELLARCHNAGIIHRGFTPANLLYKIKETKDDSKSCMQLMWIDVASCRRRPGIIGSRAAAADLEQIFSYFDFSPDKKAELLEHYRRFRHCAPASVFDRKI